MSFTTGRGEKRGAGRHPKKLQKTVSKPKVPTVGSPTVVFDGSPSPLDTAVRPAMLGGADVSYAIDY